jgi:hypothetical protein
MNKIKEVMDGNIMMIEAKKILYPINRGIEVLAIFLCKRYEEYELLDCQQ